MSQLKTFLILIIISLSSVSFAQKGRTQDVVFLKNGSVLRGEIQIDSDSSKIRLAMRDGSVWVFDSTEIFKTQKLPVYKPNREIPMMESGYFNTTDIGLLFGQTSYYSVQTISLNMVNGYQINPGFAVGLGVGLESFDVPLAPVFLEGKYFLFKKPFSPFVSMQSGYGIPLENYPTTNHGKGNKGGVMIGANIGMRKYLTEHFGFVASLGYRYQESHSYQQYYWWDWIPTGDEPIYQVHRYYHRFAVKVGITFN